MNAANNEQAIPDVVIIGAGPAGLMAAQQAAGAGYGVLVVDAMPSVGRKFLLAGVGGMNLTHSEPLAALINRYGAATPHLQPLLTRFGPAQLCAWAQSLGIDTFVGSSGRVFPTDMKAAPLLRAWVQALKQQGVQFAVRQRCVGWDAAGLLRMQHTDGGETRLHARAVVLALGGASWPRLGSDGAWVNWLGALGVAINPLQAANCGFERLWTDIFKQKYAGAPLKSIALSTTGVDGTHFSRIGEAVISEYGIEGSVVYAASALLREQINQHGSATLYLDLSPGRSAERILAEVSSPRGARSLSSHLQSKVGISGVKLGLLYEILG